MNALVISNERSGTHFLINTICLNFNLSPQWISVPHSSTPQEILDFLNSEEPSYRVYKSHHQSYSFKLSWKRLKDFSKFYVVRDGRDVLTSQYYHFKHYGWLRASNVSEFLRDSLDKCPERYRYFDQKTSPNMVARWVTHINSWLPLLERENIAIIRYEDLHQNFGEVLGTISKRLDLSPSKITVKPLIGRDASVNPRKGIVGDYKNHFTEEDLDFFDSFRKCINYCSN